VNSYLVFISHSSEDTWVAQKLAADCKTSGSATFLDEAQIAVGANFENDILAALRQADELLVLITPWALKRPYVWMEIGAAWLKGIPIIVLLLGVSAAQFQEKANVPVTLKQRNLLPLNHVDRYLDELAGRITASGGILMSSKVFISHARQDDETAKELVAKLQDQGIDTWFDQDQLKPGQSWDEQIRDALIDSETVLLVLGDGEPSPNVLVEAGMAMGQGKRVLPVFIGDSAATDVFSNLHPVTATGPNGIDNAVEKIRQVLTMEYPGKWQP